MKKRLLSPLFLFVLFTAQTIHAQQAEPTANVVKDVQVTHAQLLGKTPPVRDLVPVAGTTQARRETFEDRKKNVPNFVGRRIPTGEVPAGALPKGFDPVRQSSFNHSFSVPVEPIVDIDGMDQSLFGGNPPDVCGDIGKDYYIQMINASFFHVLDKEGNEVSAPIATNTLWSQVGMSSAGDPIILYDQEVERWIITEFPSGNTLLFAVSDSSDPLDTWNVYAFSTPSFPDYPKYSMWPNAYCVTTNENGNPQNLTNYFINRQEMLDGVANPTIQRITLGGVSGGPGFFVSTPVDWTGDNPPPAGAKPMILRLDDDAWGSVSDDGITVFEMDIDWDNPGNTSADEIFVPSAAFNTAACAAPGFGFACIPQLNGNGIDGLPEVIMHQVHYRNFGSYEVMVLNFLVNANDPSDIRAGIRWMELRRSGTDDWAVYQEGTFAPDDGLHRFMGGIAMDGSGNIGLGYSISSPDIHPGLGFTGRKASDPPGEMTVDEYVITEGFSSSGTRYGDYAQMVVDPANDKTFWYTGQYRKNNGWGTRIFSFELGRDTNDIGPIALVSPQNSPDLTAAELVRVQVKNFGIDTQTAFEVGFVFENEPAIIEAVNFTLEPDSIYTHTFAPTVDMSLVGNYDFTLFTSLNDDEVIPNDTLRLVRSKLPRYDAGITDITGFGDLICGDEVELTFVLTNFGTETLTSATIDVTLNSVPQPSIDWTGSLAFGESEEITFMLAGLTDGTNEVSATSSSPNGEVDEVMANDGTTRSFEVATDGVSATLQLLTDFWPSETTWQLTDDVGNILFAGGPYGGEETLYTETWCLDPEECYVFTIFDSAGDGICCDFGQGNYSIVDGSGIALVSSTGEFGSIETTDFCATFECMMTADIDISPESSAGANDGAILITPENGIEPFLYSIDGGDTFQFSNAFDGLPAGDYDIVVVGEMECEYEETISLPACAISFTVETTAETNSNSNDGSIEITAMNGNGAFTYSIDGGDTFQSSPNFNGLGTGDYDVVVMDGLGCTATTTVTVDIETAANDLFSSQLVEVMPNPTLGVFRVKVHGLNRANPLLPVAIYDVSGKLVQSTTIARYDGVYTGQVSLVVWPAGVYFVRFLDEEIDRMARVVKQ